MEEDGDGGTKNEGTARDPDCSAPVLLTLKGEGKYTASASGHQATFQHKCPYYSTAHAYPTKILSIFQSAQKILNFVAYCKGHSKWCK
jgi:hypothetical protein